MLRINRNTGALWSCAVIVAVAALSVMPHPITAAPLHYDEAVSGDLPGSAPFPVLPLDVGVNTVGGTSFFNIPTSGPLTADFDSFEFTVPAGTQLTSVTYSSTVTQDPGQQDYLRLEVFLDSLNPTVAQACQEFYIINKPSFSSTCLVPPGNTFASPLPLGADTYLLFEGQVQQTNFGDTTWDYTWSLTVTPVPEPSSSILFLTGLAALACLCGFRRLNRGTAGISKGNLV